jgi:hypothetical protein
MSKNKKILISVVLFIVLLGIIIFGVIYFSNQAIDKTPPNIYISAENSKTKVAIIGTYSWKNSNVGIQSDSIHPMNFEYDDDNTISVTSNQQLILGTQKLKSDKKYSFTLDQISIYKDGKLVQPSLVKPSFMNGELYLQAPSERGEYIYSIVLSYKDRGTVSYGFDVRVDMPQYNLNNISQYKTPYIGNNSKVSAIAGNLPIPDTYFVQHYISMETKQKPYGLTIYYEPASDKEYQGEWPNNNPDSNIVKNSHLNALIVFSMIDNLDEITFAYTLSKNNEQLDIKRYDNRITFKRSTFEKKYGNLSLLGQKLSDLKKTLDKQYLLTNK